MRKGRELSKVKVHLEVRLSFRKNGLLSPAMMAVWDFWFPCWDVKEKIINQVALSSLSPGYLFKATLPPSGSHNVCRYHPGLWLSELSDFSTGNLRYNTYILSKLHKITCDNFVCICCVFFIPLVIYLLYSNSPGLELLGTCRTWGIWQTDTLPHGVSNSACQIHGVWHCKKPGQGL